MAEPDLIAWTLRLSHALRDAGVAHAIAGGLAVEMLRGSATDVADVRALAAANPIDRSYLERVARALRITARLHRALPKRTAKRRK